MKTKEIKGYVCKHALKSFESLTEGYNLVVCNRQNGADIKISLVVEIPEKKITISESEFEAAWLNAVGTIYDKDKTDLMKALFN